MLTAKLRGASSIASPDGRCTPCSRKTLIYLILTLNHIYPDYDFNQLRAQHFQKEADVTVVEEAVDSHLLEVSRVRPPSWYLQWRVSRERGGEE